MTYAARRARLAEQFDDTVFVFVGRDGRNSNARYFAGLHEAVLVCLPNDAVLFVDQPDPARARFDGAGPVLEDLRQHSEIADIRPLAELRSVLPALLREGRRVAYRLGSAMDVDVLQAIFDAGLVPATGGLRLVVDPAVLVAPLRLRKDDEELVAMRRAASVTVATHDHWPALLGDQPSGRELAAHIEAFATSAGASGRAYSTIVAIDEEALTLHAKPTNRRTTSESAVLVDAGFEVDDYACDITRTVFAGDPSDAQAEVLEAVATAQSAAIAAARPGAQIDDVHMAAKDSLRRSLRQIAPDMDVEEVFMHRTSHWIGLDVHDPGPSTGVVLEPGMTFTVEPGLYFGEDAPRGLRGLGVRIEDVVAVTVDGCEVLTRLS